MGKSVMGRSGAAHKGLDPPKNESDKQKRYPGTIFKRGKWWARLYDHGREIWRRCNSQAQAHAVYCRLREEIRTERLLPTPRVSHATFKEVADEYVARLDARRRRPGDDAARVAFWIDRFGNTSISSITTRHIDRALTELQVRRVKKVRGKRVEQWLPPAPATVVRYLVVLKAILNDARRLGMISVNPADRVKLPRVNNELVRYLTTEQESLLLKHLPATYHDIVRLAIHTGMREGELLRLTWSDIDWVSRTLSIRDPKSGKDERIPLNSIAHSLLLTRKQAADQSAATARVFAHDGSRLRRTFAAAVTKAGLAPFRFHDLRHTFASRLAMSGFNDRTIMTLCRWRSPRMINRYAHLMPSFVASAAEAVAKFQDSNLARGRENLAPKRTRDRG